MQNIDLTRFSLSGAKYLGDDKFLFPKGGATSIFTCLLAITVFRYSFSLSLPPTPVSSAPALVPQR